MVEEIDIDALEVFVEDDEPLYDVQIVDSEPELESAEEEAGELLDGFSPPFDYGIFLRVNPIHVVVMAMALLILNRIWGRKSVLMGSDGGSSVAVDVDSLGGREHITSVMSNAGDPEIFARRLAAAVDARLQGLAEAEAQKGQRRGGRADAATLETLQRLQTATSMIYEDAFAHSGAPDDELQLTRVCDVVSAVQSSVERALDGALFCAEEAEASTLAWALRKALSRVGEEDQELLLINAISMWELFFGDYDDGDDCGGHGDGGDEDVRMGARYCTEARRQLQMLIAHENTQLLQEVQFSKTVQHQALLTDTESLRGACSTQPSRSASPALSLSDASVGAYGLEPGLDGSLNLDDDLLGPSPQLTEAVLMRQSAAGLPQPKAQPGPVTGLRCDSLGPVLEEEEGVLIRNTTSSLSSFSAAKAARNDNKDNQDSVVASLIAGVHSINGLVYQDFAQRKESRLQQRKLAWDRARERAAGEWRQCKAAEKKRAQDEQTRKAERATASNERSVKLGVRRDNLVVRRTAALQRRRHLDVLLFTGASVLATVAYMWALSDFSEHVDSYSWLRAQMERLCACVADTEACTVPEEAPPIVTAEDVAFISSAYDRLLNPFSSTTRGGADISGMSWEETGHALYVTAAGMAAPVMDVAGGAVGAVSAGIGTSVGVVLMLMGVDVAAWELPLSLTCCLAVLCRLFVFLLPYLLFQLLRLHTIAPYFLPPAFAIGLWHPLTAFFGPARPMVWVLCMHATVSWLLLTFDDSLAWYWAAASPAQDVSSAVGDGGAAVRRSSVPADTSVRIRFWPRRVDTRKPLVWAVYPLLLVGLAWASTPGHRIHMWASMLGITS
jgi:hypothetical protein